MNSIDYVVNKVLDAIRKDTKRKTTGYDTIGTVKRLEGNIAWVSFDNGLTETPVNKSIDCKKGDKVRVRVSNGSAFLVGNDSAPPTDDTKAEHAQTTAEVAERAAEDAQTTASEAVEEAEHTSNYFWHVDGSGAESGAHVTEIPQEEFQANPSGGNLLMKSIGIYIRKGLQKFAQFLASGLTVYNGNGETIAHLGYGPGKNSSGGTADAPYYTLGQRRTTAKTEDGVTYQPDIGNYSTAQGVGLISSGYASVAEGVGTIAAGSYSHAEGKDSVAAASWSHAGGSSCYAYGQDSYAGGAFCKAVGNDSHAEGMLTVAGWGQQFVIGTLNKNKDSNVFEIGNGFSPGSESNAFEVGWNGHIKCNELNPFTTFTATGTVTLNANSGGNAVVEGTVPTGYTPIAVQSIETAHNQTCLIGKFVLTSDGASITLRNVSSSKYSNMSVTATILCTSLQ